MNFIVTDQFGCLSTVGWMVSSVPYVLVQDALGDLKDKITTSNQYEVGLLANQADFNVIVTCPNRTFAPFNDNLALLFRANRFNP